MIPGGELISIHELVTFAAVALIVSYAVWFVGLKWELSDLSSSRRGRSLRLAQQFLTMVPEVLERIQEIRSVDLNCMCREHL